MRLRRWPRVPLRVMQPATGLLAASLFPLGHGRSLAARLIINNSINMGKDLDGRPMLHPMLATDRHA